MIIDIGSGNKNVNFHQGGGGKKVNVEERKAVTYTDNGTFTVDPDEGYDAIKGADVTVDVPELRLKDVQTVTYKSNGSYNVLPDDGYDGLSKVTVDVNVPQKEYKTQEKIAKTNGDVVPDDGYDGLSKVTVDVNTDAERGSKSWWEKVLKGGNINGIFYDKDNLTDVLYSQDNINKYYDNNGNEISVYDTSGNQIENHLGMLNPNGRYEISLYDSDNVEVITFSDLGNGISERHELKRNVYINDLNGIDNNSYNGIIITPTAFITNIYSGNIDNNILNQYRNLLPIFYLEDNENGTFKIGTGYVDHQIECDKPYAALLNKDNWNYELKDFEDLALSTMYIYDFKYSLKNEVKESTLGEYIITNGTQSYGIPNLFTKINKVTISAKRCSYAFSGKGNLKSVNMSNADTSNVTTMEYMFSDCSSLTSLDLTNFDTSNVTTMYYMFGGCYRLTILDLSSFDTTKVNDMRSMYNNCGDDKLGICLYLSAKYFNSTSLTTYDFSGLYQWTDVESLAIFVNALPQLDGTTKTVKLSTATKNALTDEQKTTIANKGWTIA